MGVPIPFGMRELARSAYIITLESMLKSSRTSYFCMLCANLVSGVVYEMDLVSARITVKCSLCYR